LGAQTTATMRVDAMVAPTAAIGLGLFAILMEHKSTVVDCFSLSGREGILAAKSELTNNGHRQLPPRRPFSNSYPRRDGITTRTMLTAMSTNDDFIDAIVEEKTAGLALNEEENTSVR
jgi:hypothetical protein